MFFIFGWNHTSVTEYGPVKQEQCQHCHNNEIWQLKKISRYFTLFFIPIFPHDSETVYQCPICSYGLKLEKELAEDYKAIAQLNVDCLEKRITEEERLKQLEKILRKMQERQANDNLKDHENSKKWQDIVSGSTTEDLQNIVDAKRHEYDPAFVIAAENELRKRRN